MGDVRDENAALAGLGIGVGVGIGICLVIFGSRMKIDQRVNIDDIAGENFAHFLAFFRGFFDLTYFFSFGIYLLGDLSEFFGFGVIKRGNGSEKGGSAPGGNGQNFYCAGHGGFFEMNIPQKSASLRGNGFFKGEDFRFEGR